MADRCAIGLVAALLVSGCASAAPAPPPVDPVSAVRATVDAINATAGGAVDVQQQVLRRLVDPARTAEQQACAAATITVRIDPVLDRLASAPAAGVGGTTGATTAGPTAGDHYRLPVLLEVFTGSLRTGTDLTGLDLVVIDGTAYTEPLCLR